MFRAVSWIMRPHLFSKVLSLYDRVVHHQPAPVAIAPDDLGVALDHDEGEDEEDARDTAPMAAVRDEGELYGVHTPRAADRTLPDDDAAFSRGQNWIEALEERSAEGGPLPEHEIDVVDDTDEEHTHPNSETKDRPIADLGSGGRGGL
jgi:hypothetical protein